MNNLMKAIRINAYGGKEVLSYEDVPMPTAGAGEVLIKVQAAGINPLDWKVRAGMTKDWLRHKLPMTPGWDVSGSVDAVGQGVENFKIGDEIFGLLDITRDGAYAEFVTARAKDMAKKPSSLDHISSAGVPLAALTAWQGLFEVGKLLGGQTVLIHGAAGGVGHFAVQFAKWHGARVIGTCSTKNIEFVRELGADTAIDYTAVAFENEISNCDLVYDTIGGDTQNRSWKTLKEGGMLVSTVYISSPQNASEFGVRCASYIVRPDAGILTRIASLIDEQRVRPVIGVVLSLNEAANAQVISQSGHVRGKIVLKVA